MIDTDSPTTFAATSARQFVGCRVCGRTLLLGERSVGYFTATGEGPFDVCELCVPRAHRFGLRSRPYSPDEIARAHSRSLVRRIASRFGAASTRRRPAGERHDSPAEGSAAIAAATAAGQKPRRGRRKRPAAALDRATLGAVPVGSAAIPVALAAFNQSGNARTLAGLYRTLGAPKASVAPRSATDREVILTVAWEIVWYQFRIMPDGIEQERGQYVNELQPRWQDWNCTVDPAGTVDFTGDVPAFSGHDVLQVSNSSEVPSR